MLQHSSRPPARQRKAPANEQDGPAPRADRQSRLGNSAIAGQTAGSDQGGALGNDELSSWLDADVEREAPHGASTDSLGPLRSAKVNTGTFGALVGKTDKVTLFMTADMKAEAFKVVDGTPCKVLEFDGKNGSMLVEVRVGKDAKKAWAPRALWSDQPGLNKDDDAPALRDDLVYAYQKGDHTPVDPKGTDTAQGAMGDCYFIASMAAVANANPQTIKEAIKYNAAKETYTVRFYEESHGGAAKPVYIEVDAYLPTSQGDRADPAYAGDAGGKLWPAIMEKAYAKWKGGYQAIGQGGYGAQAMAELTGSRSKERRPSSMKEEEVVPYFEDAEKDGMAIYAAVEDSRASDVQAPFSGVGDKLTGSISHSHRWNHVVPGTMQIADKAGKMKGTIRDNGSEHQPAAGLVGSAVSAGTVDYKKNTMSLAMKPGQGPSKGEDLELRFSYQGVVNVAKLLVANHAYAFEGVVNGKELQFYNPWGTWQPKPVTAAEFLKHFTNISTNKAPAGSTQS
ncbi:MAG: hypothetical protein EXR71_00830 [Myxococcales bacterium]|nr:hypothetical protein [Myxococcales bacterium]